MGNSFFCVFYFGFHLLEGEVIAKVMVFGCEKAFLRKECPLIFQVLGDFFTLFCVCKNYFFCVSSVLSLRLFGRLRCLLRTCLRLQRQFEEVLVCFRHQRCRCHLLAAFALALLLVDLLPVDP